MNDKPKKTNTTEYFRKLIKSGNVWELYEYEEAVQRGFTTRRKGRANSAFTSLETKLENQKKNAARARQKVRRTANANPELDKFLTLTYKENVTDIDRTRKDFDKFIKRVKTRYGKDFKFIAVIEFQQRGAVHFHLVCNLPFVNVDELAQIWGFGFVSINRRIDDYDNVGAYITKYMTKDNVDPRLAGKKSYSMSQGLRKPEEITNPKEIDEILEQLQPVREPYTLEFETEHFGIMHYTQYVCARPRLVPRPSSEKVANFAVEHRPRKIGRKSVFPAPARF